MKARMRVRRASAIPRPPEGLLLIPPESPRPFQKSRQGAETVVRDPMDALQVDTGASLPVFQEKQMARQAT